MFLHKKFSKVYEESLGIFLARVDDVLNPIFAIERGSFHEGEFDSLQLPSSHCFGLKESIASF